MKLISHFLLLLTLVAAWSCERQGRHAIIPERTMADVLYDYQLAVAMADEDGDLRKMAEKEYLYTQAVYRKYGITESQFNLSIAHYARNPKTLLAITEEVSKRYAEEIDEEQAQILADYRPSFRTDTIVIWKSPHAVALSGSGQNRLAVEIPCGEIKRGDRLLVGFRPTWIYREGAKQGYMQVAVTYANDSTMLAGVEIREYSGTIGSSVYLSDFYDVRSITLYLYQDAQWKPYPQWLCLQNFGVWSIRTSKIQETEKAKKDDKQTDSRAKTSSERRKSLAQPDSLARRSGEDERL